MNVVAFLIAMGFFVAGMWLTGLAMTVPGLEALTFFGGILCIALAVAIPVNLLGRADTV